MILEDVKSNIVEACTRLRAHSSRIEELRSTGGTLDEIETAISARRSLAQHIKCLKGTPLQEAVRTSEAERLKDPPARIAVLENRMAAIKAEAQEFFRDQLQDVMSACLLAGATITASGTGIDFRDCGLAKHLYAARSAATNNSEVADLTKELTAARAEIAGGVHLSSKISAFEGECFRKASADSGFSVLLDFLQPLSD
jgi:DNA-binding transcriptional MerR regulator